MHNKTGQTLSESTCNFEDQFPMSSSQERNDLKDCDIKECNSLENRSRSCKIVCDCETPLDTVNSWDSHSHYRQLIELSNSSLYSEITVYCNHGHLITSIGIIRIILIVTFIACIACVCNSGIIKTGLIFLPVANRIKFILFVNLLGFFTTGILLFLDVTHLIHLFPFNWIKVNTYFFVCLSVLFLIASSLILHMIFTFEEFHKMSAWTKNHLLSSSILGYLCVIESIILIIIHQCCSQSQYNPVSSVCDTQPEKNLQKGQNTSKTSKASQNSALERPHQLDNVSSNVQNEKIANKA